MICPKCYKTYYKKAYFENHLKNNSCLKKMEEKVIPVQEEYHSITEKFDDNDDIESEIQKVALKHIKNKVKKEPIDILNRGIDQIIKKAVMNKSTEKNEEIDLLRRQLDLFKVEINLLKERVNFLEKKDFKNMDLIKFDDEKSEKNIITNENIRAIKKEKIYIEDDVSMQYLECKSVNSDAELLYKIYFEGIRKDLLPIRKNKKNDCIFWNGSDWIEDIGGSNLKMIFSYNLKKIYTKVNVVNDQSLPSADYLSNQEHINKLGNNNKYQHELYTYFIEKYC